MSRARVIDGVKIDGTFYLVTEDNSFYVARWHEVLSRGELQAVKDMLEKVTPAPEPVPADGQVRA